MTLDKTFRELVKRLHEALEAVRAVRLTVSEDRPAENAIMNQFDSATDDTIGWIEESLYFAHEASRSATTAPDLQNARRSLARCHVAFVRAQQRFTKVFESYEPLRSLDDFAAEHGKAWPGWFETVQQGVQRCSEPMSETANAIAQCWDDLSERLGSAGVMVTTTNIGQQITRKVAEAHEVAEGVT
jgi:hypothetical protein